MTRPTRILWLALLIASSGCHAPVLDEVGDVDHDDMPLDDPALRPFAVCQSGTDTPATPSFGASIDGYASYDGQSTCQPAAKPGVIAFRDLVLAAYPCTGDYGISRDCSVGGKSEHKEGRAWDWKLSYPHPAADALLDWLLATDAHGNPHAMARRVGIMYMIWNNKIWKSYQASKGWQTYTGSNPHTDHVHFSFSWAGANKQTSFWSAPPPATNPPTGDGLKATFVEQGAGDATPGSGGATFSLCPGQDFRFFFKIQNSGTIGWTDKNVHEAGKAVRLGFVAGDKLGNPERISINSASDSDVSPGETVTFTLQATAPTVEGIHETTWQLVSEMVSWFGPEMWLTFNVTSQPPGSGAACDTGATGQCAAGTMSCSADGLVCLPNTNPSAEVCDGADNDCDGAIDEDDVCGGEPSPTPSDEPPSTSGSGFDPEQDGGELPRAADPTGAKPALVGGCAVAGASLTPSSIPLMILLFGLWRVRRRANG